MGLALSGALRWGPRHRRTRSVLVAVGLNLAAAAALGAILTSGLEPGGLGLRWVSWVWPAGLGTAFGILVFRFPRSVGLPVLVLAGAATVMVAQALKDFKPLGTVFPAPRVQPLTDRETVTAFALRVDFLVPPEALTFVPNLYRLRPGSSEPPEWWWSWALSRGWARSTGAALPENPLKYGVYRLALADGNPVWNLEAPELTVPEEDSNP